MATGIAIVRELILWGWMPSFCLLTPAVRFDVHDGPGGWCQYRLRNRIQMVTTSWPRETKSVDLLNHLVLYNCDFHRLHAKQTAAERDCKSSTHEEDKISEAEATLGFASGKCFCLIECYLLGRHIWATESILQNETLLCYHNIFAKAELMSGSYGL